MNLAEKQINRIISVYLESEGKIRPHFFLTGSTGSGKTHTVTKLADAHGVPLISVNTAQITNEGLAGNSLSKVLSPLRDYQNTPIIVFFDEFDKAISSETDLTTGAVQQEILKILEDSTTEVFGSYGKYDTVQTDNCLFVFAGSFNGAKIDGLPDLLNYNVRPELLGRIGLHFAVEKASLDDLKKLVVNSPLLEEYCEVLSGAEKDVAIRTITDELDKQYEHNIIGIRLINSLIHQYFITGSFTSITFVSEKTSPNEHIRDLSFSA